MKASSQTRNYNRNFNRYESAKSVSTSIIKVIWKEMSPRSCSRTPESLSPVKAIKRHQREDLVKERVKEISLQRTAAELWGVVAFRGGLGRGCLLVPPWAGGHGAKHRESLKCITCCWEIQGLLSEKASEAWGLKSDSCPSNENEGSGRAKNQLHFQSQEGASVCGWPEFPVCGYHICN